MSRGIHSFLPQGLLAIHPAALLEVHVEQPEPPKRENKALAGGAIEVVEIRGPLLQHDDVPGFDSYDAIAARVALACKGTARIVLLKISSPGGSVAGCFEGARDMRARCEQSGKRLVAYVDGQACSAAYAWACAATLVVVPPAALVGSIGVINARVDITEADKAFGTRFAFVTSGARKTDGNPHTPITDPELAEQSRLVNSAAAIFYNLVSEMRGVSADAVSGLEARLLHGAEAVQAGLADRVQSFDGLIASLGAEVSMSKFSEGRAALEEAAKGDGDEAKKAQRALAAMDASEEESSEESAESSDEEEPAAESEEGEEEEESSASAVSATAAGSLAVSVTRLSAEVAQLRKANEKAERTALLASRPDLPVELVKELKAMSLSDAKRIVAAMPKRKIANPAATATVQPTLGAGQGSGSASRLAPADKADLDKKMGLTAVSLSVQDSAGKLTLGAVVPKKDGVTHG